MCVHEDGSGGLLMFINPQSETGTSHIRRSDRPSGRRNDRRVADTWMQHRFAVSTRLQCGGKPASKCLLLGTPSRAHEPSFFGSVNGGFVLGDVGRHNTMIVNDAESTRLALLAADLIGTLRGLFSVEESIRRGAKRTVSVRN
jgi:hypothetical protein